MKHDPKIRFRRLSVLRRLLWALNHEFWNQSLYFGVGERLRCPKCGKIGTWKAHSPPQRWLCKWCGWYEDSRRTGWCRPCLKQKVWMLKPLDPGKLPPERCGRIDPWRY